VNLVDDRVRRGNNGTVGSGDRHRGDAILAVLCVDRGGADTDEPTDGSRLIENVPLGHGGMRVADTTGSGRPVWAFALASDAIRAALDLRSRLGTRVAVDVAESSGGGDDTAADVARCRRLLDTANDGQVLVSCAALDIARAALADTIQPTDLGVHRLRGQPDRCWIWQLDSTGSRTSFPPLRTPDAVASSLPPQRTTFIGREADVDRLASLIEQRRVVSIVGAGGCGKTRLAIEVAFEVAGRFGEGIAWTDLAPITEPTAVLAAVAGAVGLSSSAEVTAERLAEHLGDRSTLIVLDNCEHVTEQAALLTAAITASCPYVRIVATSREPLDLGHELVWRIPSLGVPRTDDGSDLLDSDAGRLLVDRIRLIRPDFVPDTGDAAALAEVCRRLDGIPLALELAAARTSTWSPIELASRLGERFRLLTSGARDAIARQRTLEASVAWSHQLLTADEQRCFHHLSVFSGSFSLDAAIRLCSSAVPDAEPTIIRLLTCSLLTERAGPDTRLQMLEPVRWFARDRLIDSGEADEAFARHLAWAVDTARELGGQLEGPRVLQALERLDADVDNLRSAMDWAADHGRVADAVHILAATSWYWVWRGRRIEMSQWIGRSGIDEADLERYDRLHFLWASSEMGKRSSSFVDLVDHGTALAREIDDRVLEAKFLVSLSRSLAFTDPHRVIQQAPAQREICRRAGLPFWSATSLMSEALANFTIGRFDRAEPLLDLLRVEASALRHPQLIADEISRRAIVDRRFGRYDAVRRAVVEIEAVTDGFTSLNSRALVFAQAALVAVAQGQAETSLDEMEGLFRRYTVAGEYAYLPSIALPIVAALTDLGRPAEAVERFERLWQEIRGSVSWRLRFGSCRATAMLAAGDRDRARSEFTAVVDEARATPNEHEAAIAERFLAAIDRADQRYADAEARLHRALETQAGFGYPQYVADILEELAGIELDHDRSAPAAILVGAAGAIRRRSGVRRRIGRQDAYDVDIATLRRRLGDDFDEHWHRGSLLRVDEAVEFARRGRGERRRPSTGWESLTVTERKVADLVADGHTNPEIAATLIMGRATVKTHVSNVFRKLGLTNRAQLAGFAARRSG
jgi:predicted ATPase/DNA-binding CsgD family transcriptional regulator